MILLIVRRASRSVIWLPFHWRDPFCRRRVYTATPARGLGAVARFVRVGRVGYAERFRPVGQWFVVEVEREHSAKLWLGVSEAVVGFVEAVPRVRFADERERSRIISAVAISTADGSLASVRWVMVFSWAGAGLGGWDRSPAGFLAGFFLRSAMDCRVLRCVDTAMLRRWSS